MDVDPFFNDLRARGTGIATHPDTGTGNDFRGWEFYRSSKVAYGTVIMGDVRWVHPAPSHMYFRPYVIAPRVAGRQPALA